MVRHIDTYKVEVEDSFNGNEPEISSYSEMGSFMDELFDMHKTMHEKSKLIDSNKSVLRDSLYGYINSMINSSSLSIDGEFTIRDNSIYNYNESNVYRFSHFIENREYHDEIVSSCIDRYRDDLRNTLDLLYDNATFIRSLYDTDGVYFTESRELDEEKYYDCIAQNPYNGDEGLFIGYKVCSNFVDEDKIQLDFVEAGSRKDSNELISTFGFCEDIVNIRYIYDFDSSDRNSDDFIEFLSTYSDVIYSIMNVVDELLDNCIARMESINSCVDNELLEVAVTSEI
jgi:hypothetical protein